jgi:hypothetical protein
VKIWPKTPIVSLSVLLPAVLAKMSTRLGR